MKKYLMFAAAALAFASCSKMDGVTTQSEITKAKYDYAFKNYIGGEPAPDQTWGFSDDAYTRSGVDITRSVPGITFPDYFSEKTAITMPGTIQKPTINESNATIVISESQTGNQNYDNAVVYVKNNATLTLPDWSSLQNTKFYLSSGCKLVVKNFYLKGNTDFVNDGGIIEVGTENSRNDIALENFTGTFWNNGTINYLKEFKTSNGDGGNIYLGSNSVLNATKIFLFKNVLLRNEGEITLTGEFNADQYGHKIYNSGSIITPSIILQKEVTLWNEGTIAAANDGRANISINNDDVKIYIGTSATLKLASLNLTNNRELVFNEGQLNVEGAITLENNSEIVNNSSLAGGSLDMKSGAKFYNVAGGNVNIDGLTKLNNDSGYNTWQNSGLYYTGSFEITGGCQDPAAFNNCHMYVTGLFFMNHGNFVLDGGAAVECGSFKWESDNYFHMGGKALLKVTGQLLANNWNNSPKYGFWGDATDYAVIQAGSIAKGSEGKCRAAYYGNLFIDTNNHFEQGRSSADGTWYVFDSTVKFSFNDNSTSTDPKATKATGFTINIPADQQGCTPGYSYSDDDPGDDPTPTPSVDPNTIRIIAEDLSAEGASDFDFNDVVLDVTYGNPAKVVLTHAGGVLPLCIRVNGNHDESLEVHKLFGQWVGDENETISVNTAKQKMINTGAGPSVNPVDISNKLNVNINSAAEANTTLQLWVFKEGSWQQMEAPQGEPACKLAVDESYAVLRERTSIKGTYPLFVTWATTTGFKSKWWTNE